MTRREFIATYQLAITETQLKAWLIKKGYLYPKKAKLSVSEQGHRYLQLKSVTFGDFLEIQAAQAEELALFLKRDLCQKRIK